MGASTLKGGRLLMFLLLLGLECDGCLRGMAAVSDMVRDGDDANADDDEG
jgi:hypothetical protein